MFNTVKFCLSEKNPRELRILVATGLLAKWDGFEPVVLAIGLWKF